MGPEVVRIVDLYSVPISTACPDAFPSAVLLRCMNADQWRSLERQMLC